MRLPLSWLRSFVPHAPDAQATADLLAGVGLGVEGLEATPGAPAGVVIVEVREATPVAGSDHLKRVRLFDGARERVVACGAPNVQVGMRAAYAPPGTTLPGVPAPLEAREVHGVMSEGMLCSPRELGLFDYAGGLLALADDAPVGDTLAAHWAADDVIELEITPNRADAFSVLGVARDVASKLGVPLLAPKPADMGDPTVDDGLTIALGDADRCPRFTLRRVDGVKVTPSPIWMQRRLAQLGLRPRNIVVDATNYVTFELGQPSHAYDLKALEGGGIGVRHARAGETLLTLNDETLTLDSDDLVITTGGSGDAAVGAASHPIGLAGVIGGKDDSVGDTTTAVAIEVASFEATGVRRTARRHKQITDARIRFERGVDPRIPELASARVVELLVAHAGGSAHPGISVVGKPAPAAKPIAYRPSQVAFLMALDVPKATQRQTLESLGMTVVEQGDDRWQVTPPSWRMDLALEVDVIEEVARMFGYDAIGVSVPDLAFVPPATDPTHRRLRERLVGGGMLETIGYVFTGEDDLKAARSPEARVRLAEPQGRDRAVLRTSLIPGLLANAALNSDASRLALFEVGRVFLDHEEERLGLLWRGEAAASGWRKGRALDAFVAKGALESLAEGLGARLEMVNALHPDLHPGISADVRWNGTLVGRFGRIHPEVAQALGCGDVVVAELTLPLPVSAPKLRPLPRQPYAERDLALLVPHAVAYADLAQICRAAAGERLVELFPFDRYQGPQVGEGLTSLALRFRFRDLERALTDLEVDAHMQAVMDALQARGYRWRS